MKEPIKQTKSLKDKCPTCGHQLYAYYHTPAADHPEVGVWHVECINKKCKYEHDHSFDDLDQLAKKFTDYPQDLLPVFSFGEKGTDQWYAHKDGVRISCDETIIDKLWWQWIIAPTAEKNDDGNYTIFKVSETGLSL